MLKKKEQKQKQKEIKGQMVEVNVSAQIFLRFCNEIKCHDPHRTASYIKSESLGKNSQNYFWEGGAKVV